MTILLAPGNGTPDPVAASQSLALILAMYYDRRDLAQSLIGADGSILLWDHRPTSWPPSVVVIRQGTTYHVAMTGTQNFDPQALKHIAGSFVRAGLPSGHPANGQWVGVWADVWAEVRPLITDPLDTVTIRLSGHSYGGAVAQIGAQTLTEDGSVRAVSVCGFGTAKSITTGYAGGIPPTFLWASYQDPVPNIPDGSEVLAWTGSWVVPVIWQALLTRWDTYGTPVPLGPDGTIGTGGVAPDPLPAYVSVGPLTEHSTINYYGRLAAWWAANGRPAGMSLPLTLSLNAIEGVPVQPRVDGLPRVVPGPDSTPIMIPLYNVSARVSPRGVSEMAFPAYLTGGTPFRVVRYVNENENGFTETQLLYTTGLIGAAGFAAAKLAAARLNQARKLPLSVAARIVGTRISVDGQPGTARLFQTGDVPTVAGARAGIPAQTKVAWTFRSLDATGQVRGTPFFRAVSDADASLVGAITTRLNLAPPASMVQMANDFTNIMIGAQNAPAPAAIAAFRSTVRDPAVNPFLDVISWGISTAGYLKFVSQNLILVPLTGSPLRAIKRGERLQVRMDRSRCTTGQSGTYRIIDIEPVGAFFEYTLKHMPCCVPASVAAFTGQVRPVVVGYVAMSEFFADELSTHDTGPAFFSGVGRRKGRCC